ncbi:hypothetical protein K438DRAFT_1769196 [Mycena galopus ATCC 62051]|nr:hypothetical protein K438DRAFT_1769196 [Mycena galopus ATCC 62051]
MSATAAVPMPARGDRNAPQFDSRKPHELRRYFSDLEFLFDRSSVNDDTEKKKHATRFFFSDATKTYADFKAAVLKIHAGNDEERRFGTRDLDVLIAEYARVGILTLEDLTSFYRKFLRITTYLVSKKRLSEEDQSRAFLRALQPAAFNREVTLRLHIKHPDVHPDDPYQLADLYSAAEFVLSSPSGTFNLHGVPAPRPAPVPPTSLPNTMEVKPDPNIAALVGTMTEFMKILAAQQTSGGSKSGGDAPKKGCAYCGDFSHFINECERVLEDMQSGKCKRNAEGRVVLPSGSFVPRIITGKDLRTRIEKWHEQNPGQLAAAQMLVGVAVDHLSTPISYPASTVRTYSLTEDQRLEMLQQEINVIRTRAQARAALASREQDEPEHTIPPKTTAPTPAPAAPVPPVAPTAATPAAASASVPPVAKPPQHPFSNARDAAYAPPKDRNVGLPPAAQSNGSGQRIELRCPFTTRRMPTMCLNLA